MKMPTTATAPAMVETRPGLIPPVQHAYTVRLTPAALAIAKAAAAADDRSLVSWVNRLITSAGTTKPEEKPA